MRKSASRILAWPMRFTEVIARKRDGHALSREAIDSFVRGVTDGSIPDYQPSALLMAIVLRGMNDEETRRSPTRWCDRVSASICRRFPGVKVGKHSTGGVGDKVSIVAGAAGGRLRRDRAEDVRPRPRPHRRHARQARVDSGLSHRL